MMDALPLTDTGKTSRLGLPDPGTARPELDTPLIKPETPVEIALVEIWSGVLGLDEVGTQDNFFDLGGNSLLATQIILRVVNSFQVKVSLRSLFQSPTVADMAATLAQNTTEKTETVYI